jgi:hypothetical protein
LGADEQALKVNKVRSETVSNAEGVCLILRQPLVGILYVQEIEARRRECLRRASG